MNGARTSPLIGWFSVAQPFWTYTCRVGIVWFGTLIFAFHCISSAVIGDALTTDRLLRFFLIAESSGLIAGSLGWWLFRMISNYRER